MALHRTRVGLHARNDTRFTEPDFGLVRQARIETLKTMSLTGASVYRRLRAENPQLEFIVRLFDDRLSSRSHPPPADFVAKMAPIINGLKPYATKFELHNEPNHYTGLEGWGATDADARSFLSWYMAALRGLRKACPWAKFGFPGLALNDPHRDLEWLAICREAVLASDWLGCHCYWQYDNMMSDQWGLRFKLYHQRFPDKRIEITEFGNSTPNLSRQEMSRQYVQYYQELNRYAYLGSASAFIASSPDPAWAPFVWMTEGGDMLPIVQAVASMKRKAVEVSASRRFAETGKTVSGSFLDFYDRYGPAICGNPLTEQIKEEGIATQYFERVAMEEPKTGQIRLKPIGSEVLASRGKISQLEDLVAKLSADPLPSVESVIDRLSNMVDLLAQQIQVLHQELAEVQESSAASGASTTALAASLQEQIKALQQLSDELHSELAAALKAMSEEQSALIDHLRAQLEAATTGSTTGPNQVGPESAAEAEPTQTAPKPPAGAVSQPTIEDVVDDLPKHPTNRYRQRPLGNIHLLVIHHSASVPDVTPAAIARYHVNEWDWPGIGYHFIVSADGIIYQTNQLETESNHSGTVNPEGVGICFLGSFMQDPPPLAQLQVGGHLAAWLLQELNLKPDAVKGHREVAQTACPGDQWLKGAEWKKMLLQKIASFLAQ